jgi:Na+/H+ antiporter NhaD/arsenite permease-like protein
MLSKIDERIKMAFEQSYINLLFGIPFLGVLLSLSLCPLIIPDIWHRHYGKITFSWALVGLIVLLYKFGWSIVAHQTAHTMVHEYVPFVLLIGSLFIVSGGIHVTMKGHATPWVNAVFLLAGSLLASFIGTTGAAILLIRPLINLNQYRRYRTHVIVFFIFMVANIGGSLTPLGDPPLFLGFLNGVPFFWPLQNLLIPTLLILGLLIVIFLALDTYYFYHDPRIPHPETTEPDAFMTIKGKRNFIFLSGILFTILVGGIGEEGPPVSYFGITSQDVIRDGSLCMWALLSLLFTPQLYRHYNNFSWEPLKEVAKIFAAIFLTIMPVIAMLHSNHDGPFAPLMNLANPQGIPDNFLYFWLTGLLSAFLDNAPTYLVFFHMAGGEASQFINYYNVTLVALSSGAVYMGAYTYIGNAPNFMVKAIAEKAHVKMPSFFGYMIWSFVILTPIFGLYSWIYFK